MRSLRKAVFGWQSLRLMVIYLKTIVSTVAKNYENKSSFLALYKHFTKCTFGDKFESSCAPFIFTFFGCSLPPLPPYSHS